jgi:hypothetical protein
MVLRNKRTEELERIDSIPTLILEDLLNDKVLMILCKPVHKVALIDIVMG